MALVHLGRDTTALRGIGLSPSLEMLWIAVKTHSRRQALIIGKEELKQASEGAFESMICEPGIQSDIQRKRISFARPDSLFEAMI